MARTVIVRQNSRPTLTFVFRSRRDESSPTGIVDITGYALKLMIKNSLDDPDTRALVDVSATLSDATNGEYQFALTAAHTAYAPGEYVGEVRWWTDGDTTKPPHDAERVVYIVEQAIAKTI